MAIFCKPTFDREFKKYRDKKHDLKIPTFWTQILDHVKSKNPYSGIPTASSCQTYLSKRIAFEKTVAEEIIVAARVFGVNLSLENKDQQDYTFDQNYLGVALNLKSQNHKLNRIEPDKQDSGTVSVVIDRGYKIIEFGKEPDGAHVYRVSIFPERFSLKIRNMGSSTFSSQSATSDKPHFRYLEASKDHPSWDVTNMPEMDGITNSHVGTFDGILPIDMAIEVTASSLDIGFRDIKPKFTGMAPPPTPEQSEDLARAINARVLDVLENEFKTMRPNLHLLVKKSFFE